MEKREIRKLKGINRRIETIAERIETSIYEIETFVGCNPDIQVYFNRILKKMYTTHDMVCKEFDNIKTMTTEDL